MNHGRLSHGTLLALKRWNTCTIYNGWEQITENDRRTCFNQEEARDFMPQMGVMVGYAITVVCEPGNPAHPEKNANAWIEYYKYVSELPGPKISIVQDLDKPKVIGSFWGEVNANIHRSLGCVGTITDGAIRDVDEMTNAGFKGIAKRLCVGHAYSWPVRWGVDVEVFGCKIRPGQLIHADKHGFMAIPEEDEEKLLEASNFMDRNECNTVIAAGRFASGKTMEQILDDMHSAIKEFGTAAKQKFKKK
jgi:4-hydroxy-4-methyl-2-oxoglutarate aldolase